MTTLPRSAFVSTRLILNPSAAQDDALREAINALREEEFPLDVRAIWERGDTERAIREGLKEGVEQFVLAGGDGTIHEALHAQRELRQGRPCALAALPYGTGNDFVRTIYTERALETTPGELLGEILRGEHVDVDLGAVEGALFMNAVSIGRGAEATESTPQPMKDLLGKLAYTLWGVMTLNAIEPFEYELSCEQESLSGEAWMIVIGNGQYVGGGFCACPRAELQDGLLDAVVVPRMGALQTARAAAMLLTQQNHVEHEQVRYLQSPAFRLKLPEEVRVNVDGESLASRDLCFEARERSARWLVPREKKDEIL